MMQNKDTNNDEWCEPPLAEMQERAAKDVLLQAAIGQGYVPKTCLLPGFIVMATTQMDGDACAGCNEDRDKCHGRPKRRG